MRVTPMRTPGKTPPKKSRPMEAFAINGINDHHDAGRNDRVHGRSGQGEAGAKFSGITRVIHRLYGHGPQSRAVGQGGSGDPAEDHARHHHHLGQSSPGVANEARCKPEDPVCHPAAIHDIPRQDEKRNGQEDKVLDPVGHDLGDQLDRDFSGGQDVDKAGNTHGDTYRHPQEKEEIEDRHDKQATHRSSSEKTNHKFEYYQAHPNSNNLK